MSFVDKIGSAINLANEASKGIRSLADKATATAIRKTDEIQQSIKDSASGRKKHLEEDDIRANQHAEALRRLNTAEDTQDTTGISEQDGMIVDKARNNFDTVGEYNDMEMASNVKIGSEIRDWLEGKFD